MEVVANCGPRADAANSVAPPLFPEHDTVELPRVTAQRLREVHRLQLEEIADLRAAAAESKMTMVLMEEKRQRAAVVRQREAQLLKALEGVGHDIDWKHAEVKRLRAQLAAFEQICLPMIDRIERVETAFHQSRDANVFSECEAVLCLECYVGGLRRYLDDTLRQKLSRVLVRETAQMLAMPLSVPYTSAFRRHPLGPTEDTVLVFLRVPEKWRTSASGMRALGRRTAALIRTGALADRLQTASKQAADLHLEFHDFRPPTLLDGTDVHVPSNVSVGAAALGVQLEAVAGSVGIVPLEIIGGTRSWATLVAGIRRFDQLLWIEGRSVCDLNEMEIAAFLRSRRPLRIYTARRNQESSELWAQDTAALSIQRGWRISKKRGAERWLNQLMASPMDNPEETAYEDNAESWKIAEQNWSWWGGERHQETDGWAEHVEPVPQNWNVDIPPIMDHAGGSDYGYASVSEHPHPEIADSGQVNAGDSEYGHVSYSDHPHIKVSEPGPPENWDHAGGSDYGYASVSEHPHPEITDSGQVNAGDSEYGYVSYSDHPPIKVTEPGPPQNWNVNAGDSEYGYVSYSDHHHLDVSESGPGGSDLRSLLAGIVNDCEDTEDQGSTFIPSRQTGLLPNCDGSQNTPDVAHQTGNVEVDDELDHASIKVEERSSISPLGHNGTGAEEPNIPGNPDESLETPSLTGTRESGDSTPRADEASIKDVVTPTVITPDSTSIVAQPITRASEDKGNTSGAVGSGDRTGDTTQTSNASDANIPNSNTRGRSSMSTANTRSPSQSKPDARGSSSKSKTPTSFSGSSGVSGNSDTGSKSSMSTANTRSSSRSESYTRGSSSKSKTTIRSSGSIKVSGADSIDEDSKVSPRDPEQKGSKKDENEEAGGDPAPNKTVSSGAAGVGQNEAVRNEGPKSGNDPSLDNGEPSGSASAGQNADGTKQGDVADPSLDNGEPSGSASAGQNADATKQGDVAELTVIADIPSDERLGFSPSGLQHPMKVTSVEEGAWAARAGLQVGDVLRSINGVDVAKMNEKQVKKAMKPRPLTFVIARARHQGGSADQDSESDSSSGSSGSDGSTSAANVSPSRSPGPDGSSSAANVPPSGSPGPDGSSSAANVPPVQASGVSLARPGWTGFDARAGAIIADLGWFPSAKPPDPVLVDSVSDGGWAEKFLVQEGDELVAVNGVAVGDMPKTDLRDAMRRGGTRPLTVTFAFERLNDGSLTVYATESDVEMGFQVLGRSPDVTVGTVSEAVAWVKGLEPSDRLKEVNGEEIVNVDGSKLERLLNQRPLRLTFAKNDCGKPVSFEDLQQERRNSAGSWIKRFSADDDGLQIRASYVSVVHDDMLFDDPGHASVPSAPPVREGKYKVELETEGGKNGAGIRTTAPPGIVSVTHVLPGSVAASQGVEVGHTLLKINGQKASKLDAQGLKNQLKLPQLDLEMDASVSPKAPKAKGKAKVKKKAKNQESIWPGLTGIW